MPRSDTSMLAVDARCTQKKRLPTLLTSTGPAHTTRSKKLPRLNSHQSHRNRSLDTRPIHRSSHNRQSHCGRKNQGKAHGRDKPQIGAVRRATSIAPDHSTLGRVKRHSATSRLSVMLGNAVMNRCKSQAPQADQTQNQDCSPIAE